MSDRHHQASNLPLVSVIIPAYNAEMFIAQTLESVLAQTYVNIEVLVVDDGSSDRTLEIIKSFALRDSRLILLQQVNSGVAAARNLAIAKSKGEYIAPIDADDLWSPHKIARQVKCILNAEESCGLVYTWSVKIDEFGFIISEDRTNVLEGYVYPALAYCNFIGNASVPLIKRKCLDRVGLYNTQLKLQGAQGCEDWDLYCRIAEHYQYQVVPEYLMGYRSTSQSMSCNFDSMLKSYFLVVRDIMKRHPEIPQKIFKWSEAQFYMHFARQSIVAKQYNYFFKWWLKALLTDKIVIFYFRIYRIIWSSIFDRKLSSTNRKDRFQNIGEREIETKYASKFKITPYQLINNYRWRTIQNLCANRIE